ncbi:hypothetical protein NHF45_13695 [Maricaulaceae bacterium NA33B04]|nr:hypothetical protein [Maricaulaceae bacterium NA33B04]
MKALVAPAAVISVLSIAVVATHGFAWRAFDTNYRTNLQALSTRITHINQLPYVCLRIDWSGRYPLNPACRVNTQTQPSILVWGDSNSAHYIPALKGFSKTFGFGFQNVAHGLCPPVSEEAGHHTTRDNRREACTRSANIVWEKIDTYDTVIMAASWDTYLRDNPDDMLRALTHTIEQLHARDIHVIVVGRIPVQPHFDADCEAKQLRFPILNCEDGRGVRDTETVTLNSTIRDLAQASGADYYDFNAALCLDGRCPTRRDGQVLYRDQFHLSAESSVYVGRLLVDHEDTVRVFRPLAASGPET